MVSLNTFLKTNFIPVTLFIGRDLEIVNKNCQMFPLAPTFYKSLPLI